MTNIRLHATLVVSAILFASAAGAASKPITLELKLPQKPAFARPEMAALLTAGPLSLVVVDARGAEDPAVVGAQRAKGEDVYAWRAVEPVVPAVTGFVTQVLHGWSVRLAPEADFALRLGLMKYDVNERSDTFGSTYIAEVRFMVALTDRAGAVLWTGEASGDAKRSGVDARASMCNEALSLALRRALSQALSSVTLETAAPAAPAPPPPAAAPTVIEPDALLADLTRLKEGGVADDVLVAYAEQRKLSRPLTVDEILQWKNAGIPDAAIKAATSP
jgi:hypothetical protein